jgi:two-component system OmpR family sensor kinase
VRLPIRARLTAWYATLLAAIIATLGGFLVVQLRADLVALLDRELGARSDQLAAEYASEGRESAAQAAEEFQATCEDVVSGAGTAAQLLDEAGNVIGSCGRLAHEALRVPGDVRARALAGTPVRLILDSSDGDERYRALVARVATTRRPTAVIVVLESLQGVEDAVERLVVLLLLTVPAALAATAVGGWWLARKALLPVDRMSSRAGEIGIDRLHERIPVPRASDEIARLANTLNAMLDRLERGVDEKHRLVADTSHGLRTPLAVMRMELDVSLRGDDLPEEARAVLESAREEVDGMTRTVAILLTLAQVDEGRLALLVEPVELHEAIEEAARPLRRLAAAKGVRLIVGGERAVAPADRHRMHQALTNLIENAIKFARTDGEVRVTSWRAEGEVGVTVTDDGPGIPAQVGARVFDRFFRIDGPGAEAAGSGLGLAICAEIAHAHGGRVWVDSEPGHGSAFSLALPA